MQRLPRKLVFHLFLVLLTFTVAVWAQSDRASIVGRVSDPTGAVVSGATVKVTNEATGVGFNTSSDDGGRYVTPSILKPGTYKVEASRDGFKTKITSGILLQIGDVQEVNVTLEVGAAGETITVTSEAPQLETETSNRGDVITGRQVTELPLRDRNFTNLATLTPGVSRALIGNLTDAQYFNQGDANAGNVPGGSNERGSTESARFSRSGGASISANGLRPTNNNFSLDGVDNNEPQFGTIGVFPNPDAIAEFKVETSVGKAESGRGGASISTTIQSGTNNFHGSAYYYGQNEALNATHPQLKRDRADLVAGGLTPEQAEAQRPKSTIRVHEFGFTFGGPLIKNRTFFFGDYLGQRNSIPNAFRSVVPTAGSRMGDFTGFPAVTDPVTMMPFPGNIIANLQTRPDFSPQAFALLNLFPLPTVDVNNPNQGSENFFGTRANTETIDSFNVKVDHRINDKNNLSGRYHRSNQSRARANFFPDLPTAGFGAGDEVGNTRQISINDTHAFSPTILNEAKFGWTQIEIGIFNCGVGGACGVSPSFCADIGIPNCNSGTLPTSGGILTGGFGTGFLEFTGDGGLFLVKSNNFYVADSLTIISGKHTWKAGFELRPRRLDTIDGGRSGGLKGNLAYGDGVTGNAQANMLLSQPSIQAFRGTVAPDANGEVSPFRLSANEWSFYVQDDWKVTSNLTLNLGVRYDIYPAFTERDGRLANFDVATGSIIQAGSSGNSLIDTDHSNFGPRVGFAYSFGDERRVVLRGGYGLFYTQDGVDYPPLVRNPPFTSSIAFDPFAGGGVANTMFSLTTGPPVVPIVDPPIIRSNVPLFSQQVEQKTGTIHEWNLTLQWQFARDWLFDLGYVGTRGRNLLGTRELGDRGSGLGLAPTVDPALCGGGAAPPCFIDTVTAYENRTGSNYDALQAKLEKRFSKGVLALVSYTWGHGIDDSSGVYTAPGDQRGGNFGPINPFDHSRDRGTSSLDHRHLFVTNAIWDLPLGRGKRYGGWQANVILSGQTGQHFSVGGSGPSGDTVAVLIGDPFSSAPAGRYLNPGAFARPSTNPADPGFGGTTCVVRPAGFSPGQICFGDTGRNQFTGPGFFRTDFSLFKNTRITERVTTQFGVEFFNLFNHDNRVIPQNGLQGGHNPADSTTWGDFGLFRNSLPPRTVQYRLKVIF